MVRSFKLVGQEGTSGHKESTKLDKNIVNLSKHELTVDERSLLNKGLSFVPTPKVIKTPIIEAVENFSRKLKLHNYFNSRPTLKNSYTKLPFTGKSTWVPPDDKIDSDVDTCISKIIEEISDLKIQDEEQNIKPEEIMALNELSKNSELVVKKADKGSSIVIMDKEDYIFECHRQLKNDQHYKTLEEPIFSDTARQITELLSELKSLSVITEKQFNYLKPCENPRARRFYTLPKIHKPADKWTVPGKIPAGRPIVSDCNSESEKVAEFIDDFIKSKATKHPSYIKDTYNFVETIQQLEIPKDALLITLDVESMYTNILHEKGLEAIENAFEDHEKDAKFHAIMKLLEISLKYNDFEFDNEYFLQICGEKDLWEPLLELSNNMIYLHLNVLLLLKVIMIV